MNLSFLKTEIPPSLLIHSLFTIASAMGLILTAWTVSIPAMPLNSGSPRGEQVMAMGALLIPVLGVSFLFNISLLGWTLGFRDRLHKVSFLLGIAPLILLIGGLMVAITWHGA